MTTRKLFIFTACAILFAAIFVFVATRQPAPPPPNEVPFNVDDAVILSGNSLEEAHRLNDAEVERLKKELRETEREIEELKKRLEKLKEHEKTQPPAEKQN